MSLFDPKKKKGDNLKTLSETEIQSRLYGSFRKPHLEEKSSSGKSNPTAVKDVIVEEEKKPQKSDLFTAPTSTTRLISNPQPDAPKKADNSIKSPNEWIEKEHQSFNRHAGKSAAPEVNSAPKFKASSQSEKIKKLSPILEYALYATGIVLKAILGIFQLFRSRGFSKSSKTNYWIGGILVLGILLLGIHALNNQREKAMKGSYKNSKKVSIPLAAEFPSTSLEVPANSAAKPVVKEKPTISAQAQVPAVTQEVKPYVIQVATYASLADAENKLATIKASAFPAFIQSLKRQSGRTYHCIFVGRFKTYDEAEKALDRFKKQTFSGSFPDAFVRSLK